MSGPALPSLRRRINVRTDEISAILTANSLGSVAGNLPLGILGDLIGDHLDLIITVAWVLGGAGCLLVPAANSLPLMAVCFAMMGAGLMCGVLGGKYTFNLPYNMSTDQSFKCPGILLIILHPSSDAVSYLRLCNP